MAKKSSGPHRGVPSKVAITRLLNSSQAGDRHAVDQLLPLVYDEMRAIARHKLKFEKNNHTLDTTALVHEAYFRLIDQKEVKWQSRTHFLAIAAQAMRRILINYAEKKRAIKRGRDYIQADVDVDQIEGQISEMSATMADELLALNSALNRMEEFNERGCRVVEYHFFGGLTWKEVSEVLGIAPVTARRVWNVARLWLRKELGKTEMPDFTIGSKPVTGNNG